MTQHVERQDEAQALAARGRRKVFVKSYGCQMNVYDAQRMTDLLAPEGYDETSAIEDADVVVLNTCHIRERATEKIFSELGKVRLLKQERRAAGLDTRVVVAGCVAQAEGGMILAREKAVDVVVGPQSYHNLPRMLADAGRIVDTEFALDDKFARLPRPTGRQVAARGPAAFVTIQEGCDKFCTFCVVPYTRGAELSRPIEAILDSGDFAYLAFPDGKVFGYYTYQFYPYLYQTDLGFEYVIPSAGTDNGVYLYDFKLSQFLYTSPTDYPYLFYIGANAIYY